MKKLEAYQKILFIIYMILIIFFIVLSLESADDSTNSSSIISDFISNLFRVPNTDKFQSLIRKLVGHFSYFMLIGFVSTPLYLTFKKDIKINILLNYLSIIIYILLTEFLFQKLASNRNPSIYDCLIDILGFFISSILFYIFFFIIKYNNKFSNKFKNIYSIVVFVLYISSITVYIFLSYQSAKSSTELSKEVSSGVSNIGGAIIGTDVDNITPNINIFIRKLLGHFGYFFMIGFISNLFYISFNKYKLWIRYLIHFIIGISFAFMTEFIFEKFALGRSPQIKDVLIDSIGFIFGSLVIIYLIYSSKYLLNNKYNKKHNN